jgi:hypothetical protein
MVPLQTLCREQSSLFGHLSLAKTSCERLNITLNYSLLLACKSGIAFPSKCLTHKAEQGLQTWDMPVLFALSVAPAGPAALPDLTRVPAQQYAFMASRTTSKHNVEMLKEDVDIRSGLVGSNQNESSFQIRIVKGSDEPGVTTHT